MKSLNEQIKQTIAQLNDRISKVATYKLADEVHLPQLAEALQRLTDAYATLQEMDINKAYAETHLKEMNGIDEFWNAPISDKGNN